MDNNIVKQLESRFSTSANILCEEDSISVRYDDSLDCPAITNLKTKQISINGIYPIAHSNEEQLLYDKGKLYHELAHELYSNCPEKVLDNATYSTGSIEQRDLFVRLHQTLEDGRIEKKIKGKYIGMKYYLESVILKLIKDDKKFDVYKDLAYRVRMGKYILDESKKFFSKIEKLGLIEKAINAKTEKEVVEIASKIAKMLCEDTKNEIPKSNNSGSCIMQQECSKQEDNQDSDGKDKQDDSNKDKQDDINISNDDKGESKDEEDKDLLSGSDGDGNNSKQGDKQKDENLVESSDTANSNNDIVKTALDKDFESIKPDVDKCLEDCKIELDDMNKELFTPSKTEQAFNSANEEYDSQLLYSMIESIKNESKRTKTHSSHLGGILDSNRMGNLISGNGSDFLKKHNIDNVLSFSCAILLDISGSMNTHDRGKFANYTARVLNWALRQTSNKSYAITFSTNVNCYDVYDDRRMRSNSSTNTAGAMLSAISNLTNESDNSTTKFIVVITDGTPDDIQSTIKQRYYANERGIDVLGIGVQCYRDISILNRMFDKFVLVTDVNDIAPTVGNMLIEYISSK